MAKIDDLLERLEGVWESPGFISRRARMEDDYGLYRMNAHDAGAGYQSYTSNAPENNFLSMLYFVAGTQVVRF